MAEETETKNEAGKIAIEKIDVNQYGIYMDNKKIDEEVSKEKAEGAASFYRNYFSAI